MSYAPPGLEQFLQRFEARHADLQRQWSTAAPGDRAKLAEEIRRLLTDLAAAGADLKEEHARRRAQRMLDHWSMELISAGLAEEDFSPPFLSDYEPRRAAATTRALEAATSPAPEVPDAGRLADAQQQIRFAAAARLWKSNQRDPGYLLTGDALEKAHEFRTRDRDIAELVAASEAAAVAARIEAERRHRRAIVFLSILSALLALAFGSALWFGLRAVEEREQVVREREKADEERKQAEAARAAKDQIARQIDETEYALKGELTGREGLIAGLKASSDQDRRTLAQLEAVTDKLAAIARQEALECRLDITSLPGDAQSYLLGVAQDKLAGLADDLRTVFGRCPQGQPRTPVARSGNPPDPNELTRLALQAVGQAGPEPELSLPPLDLRNGYEPAFAGAVVALPRIPQEARQVAYAPSEPLRYVNYSIVVSKSRRMALFSASNLDRSRLRTLRRISAEFASDPRLSDAQQPDKSWFANTPLDRGHLVTRAEIAWGPYFADDPAVASLQANGLVNFFPNITPQYGALNQGAWSELERWILAQHHPEAQRVGIFSGPVLADDDPQPFGDFKVPREFWKIAFSTSSTSGLIAQGFVLPNRETDIARFSVEHYAVPLTDIENKTGLDFGPILQAADKYEPPAAAERSSRQRTGDALASRTAERKPPEQAVSFRFAGFVREDAVRISDALKTAGWRIPGELRDRAAAGVNEVRYGAPADKEAADLLVGDLRAAGQAAVSGARQDPQIQPGHLQVWISR